MARMKKKFRNADVSFSIQTNFDLDDWQQSFSKTLVNRILKKCLTYTNALVKKRFKEERDPTGKKWRKLSPITVRAKRGYSGILKKTRTLMRSIRATFYGGELVMSTDVPYALIHQKGVRRIKTTKRQSLWMWYNLFNRKGPPGITRIISIPARPFMGFNKKNIQDIRKISIVEIKKSERMGR